MINVYLGGPLTQNLGADDWQDDHRPDAVRDALTHAVIARSGELETIFGREPFAVNSIHRQGIKALAGGLRASVHTMDGLIEGYEDPGRKIIAVQWHPEELIGLPNTGNCWSGSHRGRTISCRYRTPRAAPFDWRAARRQGRIAGSRREIGPKRERRSSRSLRPHRFRDEDWMPAQPVRRCIGLTSWGKSLAWLYDNPSASDSVANAQGTACDGTVARSSALRAFRASGARFRSSRLDLGVNGALPFPPVCGSGA